MRSGRAVCGKARGAGSDYSDIDCQGIHLMLSFGMQKR
jgi:hypothetical protein